MTLTDAHDPLCRAFIRSGPFPAMLVDATGSIRFLNPAAEELLGCPSATAAHELVLADFLANPDEQERVLESPVVGEHGPLEIRLRAISGKLVPARLHLLTQGDSVGMPASILLVVEDRSEAQDLERRLEDTTRQLVELEKRRGKLEKSRSIAHELNQPLTVAMGTLELLAAGGELPDRLRKRIDRVYDQLQRMVGIIRRVPDAGPR